MLLGNTFRKSKLYDLAKNQFQLPLEDEKNRQNFQELVYSFHEDISFTLELGNFSDNIKKINYILTSIYTSYEYFGEMALERCKFYLRNCVL